ncbi:thiosulfate oxidation carrier protein SoxY [Candidatus Thiosymbion oneisti]|uniref:thiosulfate oxidation carrier protein SoxY n=1 Tax=Candidatus Thiosymbion oneisti TaxID=589554 RepID=UPI000A560309|nr:thiosulfate oxidation carrier protein SoxY [Candidatus Thiosymbion oneisti]
MTDPKRRILLQGSLAAGAVGAAVGTGLLTSGAVLAAWPESAFTAKQLDDALKELLGTNTYERSDRVKLKAPDIAENGAVVPVTVEADVEDIDSISIIATGNQTPLVASFNLGAGALGFVSTRIKMAKTATVIALVKAKDQVLSASKEVKVTIGGCGG